MTLSGRSFLVVDQSLLNLDGHHYEMDLHVAEAAARLGLRPTVAAHLRCDPNLDFRDIDVLPWFSQSWTEANQTGAARATRRFLERLPVALRGPVARLGSRVKRRLLPRLPERRTAPRVPSFGVELRRVIAERALGRGDHVFAHTLASAELRSLIEAPEAAGEGPLLHVVLRRDAEEPVMRDDPFGGIGAAFERLEAAPAVAARLRFYTDTDALTAQYRALSRGTAVATLPIPVDAVETPNGPRAPGPLRIAYLGNARTEKGFQHLPDLAEAIRAKYLASGRARLLVQSNASFSLEDHLISAARRRLAALGEPFVTLFPHALDAAQFQQLLTDADLVVLPYDPQLYRRRSSGILIQALAAGRPVVVPSGCWLSDTAPAHCSVTYAEPAGLADAVARAVETFPALSAAAAAGARSWRERHTAEQLVRQLLGAA